MISDVKIASVAQRVADLCQAIRMEAQGNILPLIGSPQAVTDRLSGLVHSVEVIGLTLDAAGGQPLVARVMHQVEELMDDENVGAFLNRRWDGFPREGPRLMADMHGSMNDNAEDRSRPLRECVSGDVVTHLDGSRWEVIHAPDKPMFFLKKVGVQWQTGLDGPCLHVIPGGTLEEDFFCLGHYDPDTHGWEGHRRP